MDRVTPRSLGPGSLLWHYAGDRRLGLVGFSAGLLQLMHPGIGAGVAEHSNFFQEPWSRIERSVPEILGVIYDPDPFTTGRRVRGFHKRINGIDHLGRPYRALDPATFWWAHATFQWAVETVVDRFSHRRLSPSDRQELYLDGVEWYRRYGVAVDPVPDDVWAFHTAWDTYCADVLELTPAADRALDMVVTSSGSLPPGIPGWIRRPLEPTLRLATLGGLPPIVRRRFGVPWSIADEARYRALQLWVRETWHHLPPDHRYHPRARAGHRAALDTSPRSIPAA